MFKLYFRKPDQPYEQCYYIEFKDDSLFCEQDIILDTLKLLLESLKYTVDNVPFITEDFIEFGPKLNFEATEGLIPGQNKTYSVCTYTHADHAWEGLNEVIKQILEIESKLNNQILIIDLLNYNFRKAKIKKKNNCKCRLK